MKATLKSMCMLSILSMLSVNAFADVAGNYQCTRTGTDGTAKTYSLSVTKTDQTYTLQWADSTGYPAIYGTGVTAASINNAFSVIFWDTKSSDVYGPELFSVKPDGSLSGTWALQTANQVGTETCKKGA